MCRFHFGLAGGEWRQDALKTVFLGMVGKTGTVLA